jgi:ribosomal protein S7
MRGIRSKNLFASFCGHIIRQGRKVKSIENLFETIHLMKLDTRKPIPTRINRFRQVVDMIEPILNLRPSKIAGSSVKIPYRLNPKNSKECGLKWYFRVARKRSEKFIFDRFRNTAIDTIVERNDSFVAKHRTEIAMGAIEARTILRPRYRKKKVVISTSTFRRLCVL